LLSALFEFCFAFFFLLRYQKGWDGDWGVAICPSPPVTVPCFSALLLFSWIGKDNTQLCYSFFCASLLSRKQLHGGGGAKGGKLVEQRRIEEEKVVASCFEYLSELQSRGAFSLFVILCVLRDE
jgi:hypothetical protein